MAWLPSEQAKTELKSIIQDLAADPYVQNLLYKAIDEHARHERIRAEAQLLRDLLNEYQGTNTSDICRQKLLLPRYQSV